jgi:hypothetical protein
MTAATPGRELLALADEIERSNGLLCMNDGLPKARQLGIKKTAQVVSAIRLAAKPADTLDTPRVMEVIRSRWNFEETEFDVIENILSDAECLVAIRALSTTGEAKR